jgi:hypothetical protein
MIILIIILAYIVNVFLNRFINKIMYLKFRSNIVPFMWFFPMPVMLLMLVFAVIEHVSDKVSWFTGKHW